jgi:hypothetical protein
MTRGRGKPRLPWKRGPRAWEIAQRGESILSALDSSHRGFYSLRRAAKLLCISTQPVRAWIRLGHLKLGGPRRQISRETLRRFVIDLQRRAEPFDSYNYVNRFACNQKTLSRRWGKFFYVRFKWPKEKNALSPLELAKLVGCHPSLVIKAIRAGKVFGHRRTPYRWAITKRAWHRSFY